MLIFWADSIINFLSRVIQAYSPIGGQASDFFACAVVVA
jgi:hypothetical protein